MERDRGLFDLGPAEVVVTASAAVLAHVAEGGLDAGAIVGLEGGGQRDCLLLQPLGMLDEALPVQPDLGLAAILADVIQLRVAALDIEGLVNLVAHLADLGGYSSDEYPSALQSLMRLSYAA